MRLQHIKDAIRIAASFAQAVGPPQIDRSGGMPILRPAARRGTVGPRPDCERPEGRIRTAQRAGHAVDESLDRAQIEAAFGVPSNPVDG